MTKFDGVPVFGSVMGASLLLGIYVGIYVSVFMSGTSAKGLIPVFGIYVWHQCKKSDPNSQRKRSQRKRSDPDSRNLTPALNLTSQSYV